MPLRFGLFGGTFDPIHNAHLRMAEAFYEELDLNQVRITPAGQPYHRSHAPLASPAQRVAMAELAVDNRPCLIVDQREVRRSRAAYTIETLEELRTELGQDAELWFLIGSDALANFHTWKRWEALLCVANLAVAFRPGFDTAGLRMRAQPLLRRQEVADTSTQTAFGKIHPLALPHTPISSTDIRHRLACRKPVTHLLSPAVLHYIRNHRLYQAAPPRGWPV